VASHERHYGALQGLNKAQTVAKHGEAQVKIWRRSYDIAPPPLDVNDKRHPRFDPRYANIDSSQLPATESLKDTLVRVLRSGKPHLIGLLAGRNVLIAAHGNSLRAMVKNARQHPGRENRRPQHSTGVPLLYELDAQLQPIRSRYLGDQSDRRRRRGGAPAGREALKADERSQHTQEHLALARRSWPPAVIAPACACGQLLETAALLLHVGHSETQCLRCVQAERMCELSVTGLMSTAYSSAATACAPIAGVRIRQCEKEVDLMRLERVDALRTHALDHLGVPIIGAALRVSAG